MTARESRWDDGGTTDYYNPDELSKAKLRMKAEKDQLDKEEQLFQGDTEPMPYQYGGEDEEEGIGFDADRYNKSLKKVGIDPDKVTNLDPDEWGTEYDPIGEPDIFDIDGQKFIDMFGEPEEAEEDVSVGGPPAGDTIPANGLYIDDEEETPADEAFPNPEESWNLLSDNEKEGKFGDWMSMYSDNEANFAQFDYGKVMFNQLPQGFKSYLGEAEFKEEDHPRDGGKFTSKDGGSSEGGSDEDAWNKASDELKHISVGNAMAGKGTGIPDKWETEPGEFKVPSWKEMNKSQRELLSKQLKKDSEDDFYKGVGEAKATEEQISSDTYYYDYSDYWKKGDAYQRSGIALQAGISTDLANSEWDDLPSDAQAKIRDAGYVTSYEAKAEEQAPEIFSHMVVTDPSSPEPFKAVCDHCGYEADSVYPEMQNHLKQAHDIAVESIATESEWKVQTITHGVIPLTLGVQADEIDAVNAVKRMYFDDGFINEGEIIGVTKIGEVLHGYGMEEVTDEEDIELLSRLLDNELEEEEQGDDETEDIALIAQLLGEEEFKEEEHPREEGGKFTSGGGDSGGKHSKTNTKDIIKSIKGGSKDWHAWGRTEKNEELYAELERRNREVPTPTSKSGGKVFRDDPDAVSKMEQKVKYWEDQKDYWSKIIKFPSRDYQTPNQLGDARWFMGTNISTNLRDAKKKLEGIQAQQGRGTDLVRKPTYKGGKKRFYYSEEPKGEPPEEPWQKGGESYAKELEFRTTCTDGEPHVPTSGATIDTCVKCGQTVVETGDGSGYWFTDEDARRWDSVYNEAFADSDRPVSPNTLMRYTEPIDLPTGKNAMDQTYGVSEPETPDGQDLTGITVGEEDDSEYERIRGLIEMSEQPETVEDIERWAVSWGADKDLVKRVFDQEFGTYEGDEEITEPYLEDNWGYKEGYPKKSLADKIKGILAGHEEIIEQKPYKPVYHYFKQHPFGRRAGKQNPFGEAVPKIFQTFNSLQGASEQVSQDTLEQAHIWWDNKYPERQWSDMRIGDRQNAILAFLRDPDTTLNEADYSCPDCGLVFGDGEEERSKLAFHREEKHGIPVDPSDSFGYEGGVGSGRKKLWKSEDPKTKEKHHVGWKNYGIDDYLDKAEKDYKEGKEDYEGSECNICGLDKDEHNENTGHEFAPAIIKEQFEDPTPWVSIGKMALDTAKDMVFPSDEQAGAGGAGGAGAGGVSAGGNGASAPTGNGGEPPVVDGNGEDKEEEPSRRHGILYGYNKCPEGKVYRDGKCVEEADEDHQFSDMTDKEMEDLGDYEGHPHQAEEDGLKDAIWAGDSPLPFADFITNVIDKIGGDEDTPMNAGKVDIKKVAKNKTLITPAEEARLACNDCDSTFDNVSSWEEHGEYHDIKVNKDEPAVEGGKGSGKKDHKGWMRAIEEEHTYDFCENCSMITEQVNHKCDMCGKRVE